MLTQRVRREEIDTGQYPEPFDFTAVDDEDTVVSMKSGFVMNPALLGKWRLYVETDILYVEHFDGTDWIEQARFEA
jgi:hypothetical protein